MWFVLVLQLLSNWTHYDPPNPRVILSGNWQSCREVDGEYGERIWDYVHAGQWNFEFHMGPYHDFALYRIAQDEKNHSHADDINELTPHEIVLVNNHGRQTWRLRDMIITASIAGGASERCESFFVQIERKR